MSELSQKLKIQKDDTVYEAVIYDSTNDIAGKYLSVQIGNTKGYIELGETTDENATPMKVYRNSDKKTYAVLNEIVWDDEYIDDQYIAWVERTITEFSDDELTTIGDYAFCQCYKLTSVNLPNVINIGNNAFRECFLLASVNLPNVINIGDFAFMSCSITSVNFSLPTSIGNGAFEGCSKLTSIDLPLVTSIGDAAFYCCSKLTSVHLPLVTSIGDEAFRQCTLLTSIDLPLVTNIDYYAFRYCSKLTSIHFGKENETAIKALAGYYSNFGATNATIYFDL